MKTMKKIIKTKIIMLATVFLTTSCAYYPRLTNIPLVREKGDTRIEAGIASAVAVHASISHGLTENIAIQVAGNIGGNEHRYLQGAVGFFSNDQGKIMEVYGGFGYGYSEVSKNSEPGRLFGTHQIYFSQINFGKINLGKRANTEFGYGLKTGFLHAKMTDRDFFDSQPSALNMNNIIVEPTTTLRFGGERLKFQVGLGLCWRFQLNHTDKKYPFWPINFGFGVNYNF
jgi:hypothetical protein